MESITPSPLILNRPCDLVSFENRVLQSSRRKAIADEFNSVRQSIQCVLQSTNRFAAESVDENVVRTERLFNVAPNIFHDGFTGRELAHAAMAMDSRAF